MKKNILLIGEPMGLFIAQQEGDFEDVESFLLRTCGAEFNVAIGVTRLGHKAGYFTKLGDDPFGKKIVNMMKAENISTELIQFSEDRSTGFMFKGKVEEGNPHIFYFRKNSAASTLSPEDMKALDVTNYDTIHMTGITPALSDSCREATEEILIKARKNDMFFTFDPNLRTQLWQDKKSMVDYINSIAVKCDIFMPGIEEATILTDSDSPELIAEKYLEKGTKAIIIKLGAKGAYYATPSEAEYVEGFHVETVVDTVGAGDGFAAGVLTALKEGLPLKEAVRRGNGVGAIQVMSVGDNDGLPTRNELDDFMTGKKGWRSKDRR
ncbi:MAG: sugar kinase [Clostridiales bacterium]|nr:sugar kinase [Clostridiales bacterium]